MDFTPIDRLSSVDGRQAIADLCASGRQRPFVLTDGTAGWPARTKWTLDFFAERYGGQPGIAALEFGVRPPSGKATLLRAFIKHLDDPYADLPGIWLGAERDTATFNQSPGWSFVWEPFKNHPELFDDLSPFPDIVPNMTASLPRDVFNALEQIHQRDFYSIYISRRNTITPLHRDRHNLFACLVQFQGCKKVVLFSPDEGGHTSPAGFNPEAPDFERYPAMRDREGYSAVLQPQDMLIIPPNWPHYTRSEDHSITLSHNFFNQLNLGDYLRCLIEEMGAARK